MKQKIIDKVKEIAENLDWVVIALPDIEDETEFSFGKYSSACHDFQFIERMHKEDVYGLIHSIYTYWQDFDISEEAYLYLDRSGHGSNGMTMRDVYDDIEESYNEVEKLYDALNKVDWDEVIDNAN